MSKEVHVYNNYYDGVSKYGIGAAEGGTSVFSECNYFRNCKNPIMSSMQGTDVYAGTDTYSDSAYFEDNVDILKTAFGVANCEIDPDYIECTKDGITANAALDGGVDAWDTNGNLCDVGPFESSYCYNS